MFWSSWTRQTAVYTAAGSSAAAGRTQGPWLAVVARRVPAAMKIHEDVVAVLHEDAARKPSASLDH